MINFVNPEIVNVVENEKVTFGEYPTEGITFDELLKKIENHEEILQGTPIHFNMHDIMHENSSVYLQDEFIHIPTNTKIFVKYDDSEDTWSRTSIVLPGHNDSEAIWIADDVEDAWWKATHEEMLSGFELNAFVEWT